MFGENFKLYLFQMAQNAFRNCAPWLNFFLKFSCTKWLKMHLKIVRTPCLEKMLSFTCSKWIKNAFKHCAPWLEIFLKCSCSKWLKMHLKFVHLVCFGENFELYLVPPPPSLQGVGRSFQKLLPGVEWSIMLWLRGKLHF